MSLLRANLILLLLVVVGAPLSAITISEISAAKSSLYQDDDLNSQDWIEIWNNTTTNTVGIGGMILSIGGATPQQWAIPADTLLAPDARIVIFASGKDRGTATSTQHTNFTLEKDGGTLELRNATGSVIDQLAYPAQVGAHTYGRVPGLVDPVYFDMPTPGELNSPVFATALSTEEVTMTPSGGLFETNTSVAFAAPLSPTAVVRYTLDGSVPDESSLQYTSPITITSATEVSARIFDTGKLPGKIARESYLKVSSDLINFQSSLPVVVLDSFGFDVENNSSPNAPRPLIPMHFTLYEPNSNGVTTLSSAPTLRSRGGMRVRGQSSTTFPKKQYAFEFWNERGQDRDSPLLGMPEDSDWILSAPWADKTLFRNHLIYTLAQELNGGGMRSRFVELYYNRFNNNISLADYRGVYLLMERIKSSSDRVDVGRLNPRVVDPALINGGYIWKKDKGTSDFNVTTATEQHLYQIVEPKEPNAEQLAALTSSLDAFEAALHSADRDDPTVGYAAHIDVDSFIDNHIFIEFFKNIDGHRFSSYFSKAVDGKIQALPVWDYNFAIANINSRGATDPEGWYYTQLSRFPAPDSQYPYYTKLFKSPAFVRRYWDRFFELTAKELSAQQMDARIAAIVAQLTRPHDLAAPDDHPVARNFAQWPVLGRRVPGSPPGFANRSTYQDEVDYLKDWIDLRRAWISAQRTAPPSISPTAGIVASGTTVTLATPSGTIYYTTDGSDPWDITTGSAATSALVYSAPISFSGELSIKARVLDGGEWGGLTEAVYQINVAAPSSTNLVVSKVHYNPVATTFAEEMQGFSAKDFEWIELHNPTLASVSLTDLQLTDGIALTDPGASILPPGARIIFPANRTAFDLRNAGFTTDPLTLIGNAYSGALKNGGENLRLEIPGGTTVQEFAYSDDAPWPKAADGEGFSLVLRRPATFPDHSLAASWRGSVSIGGSPGDDDSVVLDESFTSDADNDGHSDAVEGLLGSNPQLASSTPALQVSIDSEGKACYQTTQTVGVDGVTITSYHSTDLVIWTALTIPTSEERLPGGRLRAKWKVEPGAVGRGFFRTEIGAAP